MHVSLRPIDINTEAPLIELPMPGEYDDEITDLLEDEEIEGYVSPAQLSEQLVTLSSLPTSRWLNVLDLDIVKRRNKPKQPPTAPKAAPFFLPTIPSLELEFDVRPSLEEQTKSSSLMNDMSGLGRSLLQHKVTETIQMLTQLGPSALDAEVLNLAPEGGGSMQVQIKYLQMLQYMLSQKSNFELAQTYLAVFLKHHADACIEEPQLSKVLETLQVGHAWSSLETRLLYCMSVVNAFKSL
jgi:U3 small nucleolar RNA-associated protein 21